MINNNDNSIEEYMGILDDSENNDDSEIDFKIDALFEEFYENRENIKKMIIDLEELKVGIEKMFPKKFDKRYQYLISERIQAVTNIFGTLLDMRKEINRSIKNELELRRKVNIQDKSFDIDELMDMSSIAKKINQFNSKIEKTQKQIEKKLPELPEPPSKRYIKEDVKIFNKED
jgi:hypothetical protein